MCMSFILGVQHNIEDSLCMYKPSRASSLTRVNEMRMVRLRKPYDPVEYQSGEDLHDSSVLEKSMTRARSPQGRARAPVRGRRDTVTKDRTTTARQQFTVEYHLDEDSQDTSILDESNAGMRSPQENKRIPVKGRRDMVLKDRTNTVRQQFKEVYRLISLILAVRKLILPDFTRFEKYLV